VKENEASFLGIFYVRKVIFSKLINYWVRTLLYITIIYRMPYGGAWNIKNLCDSSLGTGLSQVLPKFEPFDSGFITFFSNSRTFGSNSFTHYNIPQC